MNKSIELWATEFKIYIHEQIYFVLYREQEYLKGREADTDHIKFFIVFYSKGENSSDLVCCQLCCVDVLGFSGCDEVHQINASGNSKYHRLAGLIPLTGIWIQKKTKDIKMNNRSQ